MKGHLIIVGRSTLLNYCYNKILTTLLKKKNYIYIYIYIYVGDATSVTYSTWFLLKNKACSFRFQLHCKNVINNWGLLISTQLWKFYVWEDGTNFTKRNRSYNYNGFIYKCLFYLFIFLQYIKYLLFFEKLNVFIFEKRYINVFI